MNQEKKHGTKSGLGSVDPDKTYINADTEDQMEIIGYQVAPVRRALCYTLVLLSAGLLWLVFHWRPDWLLRCTHTKCPLINATKVLLKNEFQEVFVEKISYASRDSPRIAENDHKRLHLVSQSDLIQARDDTNHEANQSKVESFIRYFTNKKLKYIWNPHKSLYEVIKGPEEGKACSYFHQCKGLVEQDQAARRVFYGENSIPVHVTPIIRLMFTEILNPFYIFQIFSVILWYFDEYYYYASCIILISVISITTSIYQIRKMQRALKNTIAASGIVSVCRGGEEYHDVPSDLLVPGDVIEVPRHGCIMSCDAVLISGNCIVNESMLTGESVPVTKTPIPNAHGDEQSVGQLFDINTHSRHILFCGTRVIQTRYYGNQRVRAVVIRTGFFTAKGDLVRSILFPKPMDFKFTKDAFRFIGVLAAIAACGMLFTIVLMVQRGNDASHVVLRTLDLITIVIPPALPAAMTVGIVFAQSRLKNSRIYCISPSGINVCGTLNVICFDKTGTLTEDGLDMWGVVPVEENRFLNVVHETKTLPDNSLKIAMATGHSLTIIEGVLSGDPLDLKMFEATGWELEEPGEDTSKFDVFSPTVVRPSKPDVTRNHSCDGINNIPFEIGIVRQFTFSSSLQRMSVITRTLGASHFDIYAKGSPEMIASLCLPHTVPVDFHDVLLHYTQQGFRVLALAGKALPTKYSLVKIQRIAREQVECDLTFLGLLVMENRLKPQTTPVIRQLKDAALRVVMVTGDNMLTALSVARDCRMIEDRDKVILAHVVPPIGPQPPRIEWTYAEDQSKPVEEIKVDPAISTAVQIEGLSEHYHFAITGKSWALIRDYWPELVSKIAVRGTVFARMSPDQKIQVVETLQELGYYVGMCGDGANDCGALKTAHAGISLSEAEASVASPFTSKEPNITCVPTVCREGRAALVTSFGIFKYMALYSLTQFTSVTILYWIDANITDFQFLYIDLILLTSLSITFGRTAAYPVLVRHPPPLSLISATPILSMLVQMLIIIAAQLFGWLYVRQQPWFEAFVPNDDYEYAGDENTAIFNVASFQYIVLAIILSKSAPYRKTIFSNYWFLGNLAVLIALTAWLVVYPPPFMVDLMELKVPPSMEFRLIYIGIAVIYFLIAFIVECFIIDSEVLRKQIQKLGASFSRKHRYAEIEEEIVSTPSWPPISQSTLNLAQLMRMESVANGNPDVSAGGDNPLTAKHTAAHDSKSVQALNDTQGQSQGHTAPSNIQLNLPSSPGADLPSMPLITNTASDQSVSRSMSYDTCPLVENEVAPSVPPVLTTVL